jgi:beta-catenin-like protein 1
MYALIRNLREDSPNDALERVLAKFVSNNTAVVEHDHHDGQPTNRPNNHHQHQHQNEKVNRLVDLLLTYDQKARLAEYNFYRSDIEERLSGPLTNNNNSNDDHNGIIQLAAMEAKLAGGGEILHRLAAIAAFCCSRSKQCHQQILAQLKEKNSGISLIREALEEFISVLDESSEQKQQLETYLDQI